MQRLSINTLSINVHYLKSFSVTFFKMNFEIDRIVIELIVEIHVKYCCSKTFTKLAQLFENNLNKI